MQRIEITDDELRADLEAALGDTEREAGYTTNELCSLTTWNTKKVRLILRKLINDGKWEHIRVLRLHINGQECGTDAYRPVVSGD